jgi:hypothetical protein
VNETLSISEPRVLAAPPGTSAPRDHRAPRGSLSLRFQYLVWMPVVLVGAGAVAFWHFVAYAFMSNPALNSLIFLAMAWGSTTMLGHMRRMYREDRVLHAGLDWLQLGAWSNEPNPKLGPAAHVQGMLARLEKLGLGHQVYVQSAAMEPELEALEQFFNKEQELSQFLVGLMVGLGLLGTFVGLLETLVATSTLIGTIANSVGGSGSGMESEFAKIVGGLQKPLTAMGTAFSASMFGLIGSIMLGFQMVIVRQTATAFIEHARNAVLSLAEKTKVNANVEITERFLATLLADVLTQHKESMAQLGLVSTQLVELVPQVREAALSSVRLGADLRSHSDTLERTTTAVGSVRDVVPVLGDLAGASRGVFEASREASVGVAKMLEFLPQQSRMLAQLDETLKQVATLSSEVTAVKRTSGDLLTEIRLQGSVVKRLDATLWNAEKASFKKLMNEPMEGTS